MQLHKIDEDRHGWNLRQRCWDLGRAHGSHLEPLLTLGFVEARFTPVISNRPE